MLVGGHCSFVLAINLRENEMYRHVKAEVVIELVIYLDWGYLRGD